VTGLLRRLRGPVAALVVVGATAVAVTGLAAAVDLDALRAGLAAAGRDAGGLLLAAGAFAAAFGLRAAAWVRALPGLPPGHALAGVLVALGGNHVLPLRLGEPLRVLSVVRRAGVDPGDAAASTVLLRSADLLALLLLGVVAGPAVVVDLLGAGGAVVAAALVLVAGAAAAVVVRRGRRGAVARLPDATALALTAAAWLLEAVLVWQVLRWFGLDPSPAEALVVLAAAVGAQLVAVAPGGLGTYEAAATAALVATGAPPGRAVAAALALHGLKTAVSLLLGAAATALPGPALWGRLRLPRRPVPRPAAVPADGPVVLFLPARDEAPRVADVVRRAPAEVRGIPVVVLVVDDGSQDGTAAAAAAAGAVVVRHDRGRGLGAAVRTGLAEATARRARAVAFCDADGEYDPAELDRLVAPVLDGTADYVVGSRFAGTIRHMRPHRRVGNLVLTGWVRWTVRRPVTDGQSGYRALSPAAAAAAVVPHDYNYAQVLTVDLLGRGFAYAEVGIDYRFRTSGRSFVRTGRYLRRVVPTVWRQLNPLPTTT
jgi:uncharacterized membrane protein YbhN (UPF0104 family)